MGDASDKCRECVDDRVAAILRAKSPAERLALANGLWRSARSIMKSIICQQHPEWTEAQVDREAARRLSHGSV